MKDIEQLKKELQKDENVFAAIAGLQLHLEKEDSKTRKALLEFKEEANNRFDNLEGELKDFKEEAKKRFDYMDKRFDYMDKRFDNMDKRLDNMDKRLDNMDKRLDNMDKKFESKFDKIEHLLSMLVNKR